MIVCLNHGCGRYGDRCLEDLAGVDDCRADAPDGDEFHPKDGVARGQVNAVEVLSVSFGHKRMDEAIDGLRVADLRWSPALTAAASK